MEDKVISLSGMYKEYFLDYASYVILERAVPHIHDGLKPVQRRILYSMRQMDDGRYHKVANIIGQTMQYHPHGDAAIGDALVNLGQKDLLIDCQGNWGDVRTGDSAAASRYIEARLSKFALEVLFNPQTTQWQLSYDGRKNEPVTLPAKFPLLLAQGVEGIAVGLATKILPHNFNELLKASISLLQGKKVKIYPDFQTGGMIDVSEYESGVRGGRVKVRAKINMVDKSTLSITELPFGVTTGSLIESILKANDKGQIKIKKITDNTAKEVEIQLELMPGISPDLTMDALYAFTQCEVSISTNSCVIIDNKPHFLPVEEILRICTDQTLELLKRELEIRKGELEERWHMASLEKVFIEKRIYHDIEECESWEEVLETIRQGLKIYVATPEDHVGENEHRLLLMRNITEEDLIKLTEIRIKRISKYNTFKADELILNIEEGLQETLYHLDHLTEYTISWYQNLIDKYGKDKNRKTIITSFDKVEVQQVVANNAKLYVDRKEGFIGMGMKKDEFVCECSDIDDIIVMTREGICTVTRITDKTFVGKNIIHVDVWKKNDERTTYNMIYLDDSNGRSMAKRFNISAITRDKPYQIAKGGKNVRVHYLTVQPNGESEIVQVQLTQSCTAKKKIFEFDFAEIAIKGREAKGNIVTRYPVRKISQVSVGKSSLGAMKVWIDEVSGKLNTEGRGLYIGAFDTGAKLLMIFKDGSYELSELDLNKKIDPARITYIHRFDPKIPISVLYFEGDKEWSMVKRFLVETTTLDQSFTFISDAPGSKLYYASQHPQPKVLYSYKMNGQKHEESLDFNTFIDVKGWKAMGNKLGEFKILKVTRLESALDSTNVDVTPSGEESSTTERVKEDGGESPSKSLNQDNENINGKYKPGDTIELDF